MFSIIIPAYNEAAVIGRCLSALQDDSNTKVEIIVVCNGCTDQTADIASEFDGVRVIETDVASKVVALNLGDAAAKHYPRVFLDADVRITGSVLAAVVCRMMQTPGVKVGAPSLEVDYSQSSWPVQSFYQVWTSLPYFKARSLIGSGIYILSESGRKKFLEFPDIIADDAYVRAQFAVEERYTDPDYSFTIFAPRQLKDLIKIKTRSRFGNIELMRKFPTLVAGKDHNAGSLLNVILRKPNLILSSFIYCYVQLVTMQRAKKRLKLADFETWERDESARTLLENK